ncbi:unnamed protein product, partial [Candidula unifasciata]
NVKLNEFEGGLHSRVLALQSKWRAVWHMSVDRKKRLQDAYETLLEIESFKNFDFDLWRLRYLNWIQSQKFRVTDFFRRQDKDSDGFLDREQFVSGMLKSKFPTTRTELNAVFDMFDNRKRGLIEYKNFVDAVKTDRRNQAKSSSHKAQSDMELIHAEIERELSTCQCRQPFTAEWIDEGKYMFGEKRKLCLVRYLNKTVMVRVGGGWVTLEEFVEQNDPCRGKGRTNLEYHEHSPRPQTSTPNNSYTVRPGSASGRTSPFPTGVRRRPNDTGYASSNSSGSNDSSLRRSRIATSMMNLASNLSLSLGPATETFGSSGNLNRTKRLSNSSSNLSGRKTPTPLSLSSNRRLYSFTPRATTPTVAFGTSIKSRPTTPSISPRTTSTPPRASISTPTKMGMSQATLGPPRQRRLPSTPQTPSQGFR